jgi:hypothetical protein
VDVGSAVGLERKPGQDCHADAGGEDGLHDDHVVAE